MNSSVYSSASCVSYRRCCETCRGIPVDFTVAAEIFQKEADSNAAKVLKQTLREQCDIIAKQHYRIIRMDYITLAVALNMGMGLSQSC
jgi:hypothetical protein